MVIDLKPKTAEFKALAEWLESENGVSLDQLARDYKLDSLKFRAIVSEIYTRCTNAAIAYHSDIEDEVSHACAAQEQGVAHWIYIYFKTKYGVYHSQSDEALEHANQLKKSKLYDSNLTY